MKRRQILILPILVMACLCFNSCSEKDDTNPDDKCGAKDIWYGQFLTNFTHDELLIQDRYLYYEDASSPIDICAENKIIARFNVLPKLTKELEGLTSIQGKLYWGLNEEIYITLKWDKGFSKYTATLEADIKPFFGDGPGWVGATLIYKFPTQGTIEDDKAFIANNIIEMPVYLDYFHF